MTKFYTGVGSRKTPDGIQAYMRYVAHRLEELGYVLRSGGAKGADEAFESGVRNPAAKEIYLPVPQMPDHPTYQMAAKIHPAWNKCSGYAKSCHARNINQVLGMDLKTPSEFIVCWTSDGLKIGGTRTAIVLAEQHNIPVFNLGDDDQFVAFSRKMLQIRGIK